MPITVGPMQLIASEATDVIESQVTGTDPDGGFHTNWSRLSGHDHSGGLLGNPVAVTIPDGSITTADLDPSVLAPYVKRDGTTPISGTQELQADLLLRDAITFGPQGSAAAADATLARTGAGALRVDTNLGVGVNPAAWGASWRAAQIGTGGALFSDASATPGALYVGANSYNDGATNRALSAGPATRIDLRAGGDIAFNTAASVGAGAAQTMTSRMLLGQTGTLTLAPDAGAPALDAGLVRIGPGAGGQWKVEALSGQALVLNGANGYVHPAADNTQNLGAGSLRWVAVYAVNGTIQTSSQEFKEGITPLDPALALEAVRATPAVTFTYTAPQPAPASQQPYRRPQGVRFDWKTERSKLISAPLAAAARTQAGFVAEQAHPLFLTGEGQANPANTNGVFLGALQALDTRVTALETPQGV